VPKPERKFVNPLLRPSPETQTQTLPPAETSTETPTSPSTETSTSTYPDLPSDHVVRRKRGEQAFEKTHERITLWIDKQLKAAFEQLANEEGTSKTMLLNEAIADLLKKRGR
jgi:hypothetical protein